LSAFHALSPAGYSAWLAGTAVVLFLLFKNRITFTSRALAAARRKICRRFHRGFPAAFLLLAALILAGGLLYPPNNFDALSYRIPRMMHWWMRGSWHWIDTPDARLNTRVCGFEWLCMPLLVLFRSDRGFFLANFISFLFLPGLLFSFLSRLGIRGRLAWYWMWIFPAASGFALQAGGMANDAYAAIYSIAMIDLALRARATGDGFYTLASLIAAALMTGAKNSNLPLLLCWGWAVWPSLPLLKRRPAGTLAALVAAAVVSTVPTIVFNVARLRDWTGYAGEKRVFMVKNPVVGVVVNSANLLVLNTAPPFFPFASRWNRFVHEGLPAAWRRVLRDNFEPDCLELRELPSEEWAGVGIGIVVCVACLFWLRLRSRDPGRFCATRGAWMPGLLATPWLSLLVFMSKSGMAPESRLILPYFPLLLPGLVIPLQCRDAIRSRLFRAAGLFALLVAVAIVVINPARPLFPALTLLGPGSPEPGASGMKARARRVFTTYRERHDTFQALRQRIPAGERRVGFISLPSTQETSLWLPYGARTVVHLSTETKPENFDGLRYVIADASLFATSGPRSLEQWLKRNGGTVVQSARITFSAALPDTTQLLIKLDGGASQSPVAPPAPPKPNPL
jgi:hypothetical protein